MFKIARKISNFVCSLLFKIINFLINRCQSSLQNATQRLDSSIQLASSQSDVLSQLNSDVMTASDTSISGRTSKKLLRYDGTKDLDVYLGHLDLNAGTEGWTYEQKGHQLATSLTDRALEVYLDSDADLSRPDYNHTVSILQNHFKPKGQEEVFLAEFATLTKKASETFQDFVFDLRKLAKRAYPRVNDAGREDIVKQRFIESLDEKMGDFVLAGGPKSMHMILSLATQYEARRKSKKTRMPVKSSVNSIEDTDEVNEVNATESAKIDALCSKLEILTTMVNAINQRAGQDFRQ